MNTKHETEQNIRTAFNLELWKKISVKLRRKVEHEKQYPLQSAAMLAGSLGLILKTPEERKEMIGENWDEFGEDFLDLEDASAGMLSAILDILPAPRETVSRHEKNPVLDGLAKKTWASWERWGDSPFDSAVPIMSDHRSIEIEMGPLIEELTRWASEHKEEIARSVSTILSTKKRRPVPYALINARKTPKLENYLTRSQILQLGPELEAFARNRDARGWNEETDLATGSFLKKLEKFESILEQQGIDPGDVLLDALNHDCLIREYRKGPGN